MVRYKQLLDFFILACGRGGEEYLNLEKISELDFRR